MSGPLEWIGERWRERQEAVEIDPAERTASLTLKLAFIIALLFISWGILLYHGILFTWGLPVTSGLCAVALVVACVQYSIVWMEKDSRWIEDLNGFKAPVRRDSPIKLDIGVDENGKSPFKILWKGTDRKTGKPMDVVQPYTFQAIQQGLSSYWNSRRHAWCIYPHIPVKVPTFRVQGFEGTGDFKEVDYGGIEWGPRDSIKVNGGMHLYKKWKSIPKLVRDALLSIPNFRPKRDRVRICYLPSFDFSSMDKIAVPIEVKNALESLTGELDTTRKALDSQRIITEKAHQAYAEDAKSGKRPPRSVQPYYSGEEEEVEF